jgi:hypothetical protein
MSRSSPSRGASAPVARHIRIAASTHPPTRPHTETGLPLPRTQHRHTPQPPLAAAVAGTGTRYQRCQPLLSTSDSEYATTIPASRAALPVAHSGGSATGEGMKERAAARVWPLLESSAWGGWGTGSSILRSFSSFTKWKL